MSQHTKQQVLSAFYDPNKKVSEEDFHYILELGRLSPSSVGSEPWHFLVVQDRQLREQLKAVSWGMQTQLDDASYLVFILAKKNARYDSPYFHDILAKRGLTETQMQKALAIYERFQRDDIQVLDNERTLFDWACKQTYIALANMMTGAAMIGIDSCPVEGFDYCAVNQLLSQTGAFDPNEYGVSVAVTFGYRAKEVKAKSRKPLTEITTWLK